MSRRLPRSSMLSARCASALTAVAASVLLSACFTPFDGDPRLARIGAQLEEGASLIAAQRAAEVFDPGAPLVGGAALGNQRAAIGVRAVAATGSRPDLSTADANPATTGVGMSASSANSQTLIVDGAVRVLPGFSMRSERYAWLGLDGLARVASVTPTAPGDASGRIATGYGARLGLLTDREHRQSLSLSVMRGSVPGASYESAITPTAPATSALASLRVDRVSVTAVRLQGNVERGAWGLSAGIGANSGTFDRQRLAQLTYADSVTMVEDDNRGTWNHGLLNIGITRRVQRAQLSLQYGHAEASTGASDQAGLLRDVGPRRSVSLGVQFVY